MPVLSALRVVAATVLAGSVAASAVVTVGVGIARAEPAVTARPVARAAGVAAAGGPVLASGQSLAAGQSLVSPRLGYRLTLQTDGNLVLGGPRVLWQAAIAGRGGARLDMQTDGNLVVYDARGRAVWWTSTSGRGGAQLAVDDDATIAVSDAGGVRWAVHTTPDRLAAGQALRPGEALLSRTGYTLTLQPDGNLVLYTVGGPAAWWTGTSGPMSRLEVGAAGDVVLRTAAGGIAWDAGPAVGAGASFGLTGGPTVAVTAGTTVRWASPLPATGLWRGQTLAAGAQLGGTWGRLVMQADGNLVRYLPTGGAAWWTRTSVPGSHLSMQADGNLVVYGPSGTAVWWSGTANTTAGVLRVSPARLVNLAGAGRAPVWIEGPPNWAALALCESSGNPRGVNPAGYYGLYQFDLATWVSNGGTGNPIDATPAEQTRIASVLYLARGRQPWPVCGVRL